PSLTVPKPPDSDTFASRAKNVSPNAWSKRPGVPVSARKKAPKAKPALRPLPRSSVPFRPHHEVVMPPEPNSLVRSLPDSFMEPAYMSTKPDNCTLLCACAAPMQVTATPKAIRVFFTCISLRRTIKKGDELLPVLGAKLHPGYLFCI